MGTFSIWHWLVVLLVVVLIFGTKKLKNLGSDLGSAVRGFKDGMKTGADTPEGDSTPAQVANAPGLSQASAQGTAQRAGDANTIDVEARPKA